MKDRILVSYYEQEANKEVSQLNVATNQLQKVIDTFNGLADNASINGTDELARLFNTDFTGRVISLNVEAVNELLIKKLFPTGKMSGLPINPETIFDVIHLPPFNELKDAVSKVRPEALQFMAAGYYTVTKSKIETVTEAEKQIHESFKVYADTEAEIQRYEAAKSLADALNHINNLLPDDSPYDRIFDVGELASIIDFDDNGELAPADYFIKLGKVASPNNGIGIMIGSVDKPKEKTLPTDYVNEMVSQVEPVDPQNNDSYIKTDAEFVSKMKDINDK